MPKSGNPWKKLSTKYENIMIILDQVQETKNFIKFHGKKSRKKDNKRKNCRNI